ncbi:T9SS type A sorting domain-containing protein [Epilithonimonas zeae]|uniref:T9SS type A sorting domain-containing protein n=1 Tax=Epilithonimonas zeae TaxID=1416779 RepID=UPI00200CD259|nr:T9SS type A sorting domain-containing protein [Epilithonimonas zeae]UQB70381.1 T9SS type A sorting domain-containing protein [Epilithonimonas zeae]
MKKFYSLLAAVVLTATINAQIYSTGFESSESFASDNVYNNTTVTFSGATGKQWGTFYGTPSTTSPLTGNQSMQMRWYTSATNSKGYTYTNFNTTGVEKVTFNAANTNGINVIVSYSANNGTTWLNPQTFTLTATKAEYTYNVPSSATGGLRFKFELTYTTAPTATSRLYLDDVKFFAPTMAVIDATKGKANLVKTTIVSNELIFGTSAKISIYNTAGQIVKTAEVNENSRLDISVLPKGIYVVTGLVEGQVVSQKVIKK